MSDDKAIATPTQEQRVNRLKDKIEDLKTQRGDWAHKLALAETNVNRIDGAISIMSEELKSEEIFLNFDPANKRSTTELEGKPLHDGQQS